MTNVLLIGYHIINERKLGMKNGNVRQDGAIIGYQYVYSVPDCYGISVINWYVIDLLCDISRFGMEVVGIHRLVMEYR